MGREDNEKMNETYAGYERKISLMDPRLREYEEKMHAERRRREEEAAKGLVPRDFTDAEIVESVANEMRNTLVQLQTIH
ncbi:MAG: hypothetical protein LBT45_00780 [Rickettsiales bacterium]|jgi:hypothetical protein|nr:hypothetical protein [Rickettsiales bacterium]